MLGRSFSFLMLSRIILTEDPGDNKKKMEDDIFGTVHHLSFSYEREVVSFIWMHNNGIIYIGNGSWFPAVFKVVAAMNAQ